MRDYDSLDRDMTWEYFWFKLMWYVVDYPVKIFQGSARICEVLWTVDNLRSDHNQVFKDPCNSCQDLQRSTWVRSWRIFNDLQRFSLKILLLVLGGSLQDLSKTFFHWNILIVTLRSTQSLMPGWHMTPYLWQILKHSPSKYPAHLFQYHSPPCCLWTPLFPSTLWSPCQCWQQLLHVLRAYNKDLRKALKICRILRSHWRFLLRSR